MHKNIKIKKNSTENPENKRIITKPVPSGTVRAGFLFSA